MPYIVITVEQDMDGALYTGPFETESDARAFVDAATREGQELDVAMLNEPLDPSDIAPD